MRATNGSATVLRNEPATYRISGILNDRLSWERLEEGLSLDEAVTAFLSFMQSDSFSALNVECYRPPLEISAKQDEPITT